MKTHHLCIIGDSRKMVEVRDNSVHLVVTSPPYWQLKDYGNKDQIGFDHSYEDYINNLNLVWNECHRVLHPGCRMLVNIGDQFARSVYYGRYKIIPIRTEIIKFCETIGFDYMGAILWQKKTTMNTTGGASLMGSYPFPRNGMVEIDYEFILLFKKAGKGPKVSKQIKNQSGLLKEKWKEYFSGHWYFGGERQDGHVAMFPVELPKRAIEMFTFVGETVLDPFLGSGTTSLAARLTNRNSIGYEINADFLPLIRNKVNTPDTELGSEIEYREQRQQLGIFDWQKEIKQLKYIFHDPVKFDKKMDPTKLRFGSKIKHTDNGKKSSREVYYIVKDILDVNLIRLNNNQVIRLIGVNPIDEVKAQALSYLHEKVLKKKVYLRFDKLEDDSDNNRLAYVYTKNRISINSYLIKAGYAEVDSQYSFKYKSKYNSLSGD